MKASRVEQCMAKAQSGRVVRKAAQLWWAKGKAMEGR